MTQGSLGKTPLTGVLLSLKMFCGLENLVEHDQISAYTKSACKWPIYMGKLSEPALYAIEANFLRRMFPSTGSGNLGFVGRINTDLVLARVWAYSAFHMGL